MTRGHIEYESHTLPVELSPRIYQIMRHWFCITDLLEYGEERLSNSKIFGCSGAPRYAYVEAKPFFTVAL